MGRTQQQRSQCSAVRSLIASYKEAHANGDTEEESRWANQIGHFYKDQGEYVEALTWFRIDYDIASGRRGSAVMSPSSLMPTCQSMGEIYYRMQKYQDALVYQEQHYLLAKQADEVIEQQRASTQLGRTYLDLYESREEDLEASRMLLFKQKCEEFFTISMELAKVIVEKSSRDSSSFIKELVDAYNNLGLMKMVFEDYHQAKMYFYHGLNLCNDEEIPENDDSRSRIHHNLGRLYCERRDWNEAQKHMNTDIKICAVNKHTQGEAKGLINLGQLSFKRLNFGDALHIFSRALKLAESLEDEDVLVSDVKSNIRVVKLAQKKKSEFDAGEQRLSKLEREAESKIGTDSEHNSFKRVYKLLVELLSQAEALSDWKNYFGLSMKQKAVAERLNDAGNTSDAYLNIGQADYQLCKYEESKEWYLKSFDTCKRANHLEGQAIAKINYGNALDANGEWRAALKAYEEAYKIAASRGQTKMLTQQKAALENMLYAYIVRTEDLDRAREVESELKTLKEIHAVEGDEEHCSETESEGQEVDMDTLEARPLASSDRGSRKRQHIVLSDDEEEVQCSDSRSFGYSTGKLPVTPGSPEVVPRPSVSGNTPEPCTKRLNSQTPIKLNESSTSISKTTHRGADYDETVQMDVDVACNSPQDVAVSINGQVVHVKMKQPHMVTVDWFLDELLWQYKHTKPEGPHPVLTELKVKGVALAAGNVFEELVKATRDEISVTIPGWIHVPFPERYKLLCQKSNFCPKPEVLNKLKEMKDGELDVCDCGLDDASVVPLLLALDGVETFFSVKLAHNSLGVLTVKAVQAMLNKTKNKNMGLELDWHDNKLGANALFEMSQCIVTLSRLEVLVLSRNTLTDRIAHDLAFVLEHAPRLQTLELEECGLTTATCESVRDGLQVESRLRRLSIAKNKHIDGKALKNLLHKLALLSSFKDLDISDVQVNAISADGVVHLIKNSSTLEVLVMKQNNHLKPRHWRDIGGAVGEKQPELTRVDFTGCKILPEVGLSFYRNVMDISTLLVVSLAGNSLDSQVVDMLAREIRKSNLQKLDVSDCSISWNGVIAILKSLQGNDSLMELNLARNCTTGDEVYNEVTVADSEDEEEVVDNEKATYLKEAISGISSALMLKFLDLSDTLTTGGIEELYTGWCSSRKGAGRHVEDGVVHFYDGVRCCTSSRSCCG